MNAHKVFAAKTDLIVQVQDITFAVSEQLVRFMSTKWAEMLDRPSCSHDKGALRLQDPRDSAQAFDQVMNVAYYQYSRLPEYLAKKELLAIARLCNRYNLHRFLKQHARFWDVCRISYDFCSVRGVDENLAIAWAFDRRIAFECYFVKAVNEWRVEVKEVWGTGSADGENTQRLDIDLLPPEVGSKYLQATSRAFTDLNRRYCGCAVRENPSIVWTRCLEEAV